MKAEVRRVEIPTYVIGEDEPNPIFFEKRNVQASAGNIFPMAFNNKMCVDFRPVSYEQIVLENDYVEVTLLPQLGGRIYTGLDKTNGYDFIYRNQVIKPQQIGLTGPWISGGIEFNWPQHHRPTTFLPVEYVLEANSDGSTTAWMGEVEPLYRTKGMVGITVHPDKSYVEAKVRLFNRTPFAQSFMWWANLAVAVNDNYRAIFPKDIYWSSDHAWVTTAPFPIRKGRGRDGDDIDLQEYAGSAGGSFFTYDSKYDFLAGYDDGHAGGVVHVANRHIGTGKKIFNWGTSDFGKTWARNLSDEDGPYVELMTGLYTRNQPDFSWTMPHESKAAEQYWFPIRDMRDVKNASIDGALNLDLVDGTAHIDVNSTERRQGARVVLRCNGSVLLDEGIDVAPDRPFSADVQIGSMHEPQQYEVLFVDAHGRELLAYRPEPDRADATIPEPLSASPPADDLETVEEIYLHALHIRQYKHPSRRAEEYLQTAIARAPNDLRCNHLLGKIWMEKGDFGQAEHHLDIAAARATIRNPNPYDTEPFYNLGVLQLLTGRHEEAYDNFYRAAWGYGWKSAAYAHLAQLDCMASEYDRARQHIDLSLDANGSNLKALRIKASVARAAGNPGEARRTIRSLRERDRLDFVAAFEEMLTLQAAGDSELSSAREAFIAMTRGKPEYLIDTAVEYAEMGRYEDAISALDACDAPHPVILYYKGYYHQLSGQTDAAAECYGHASRMPVAGVLHSRLESIAVLEAAIEFDNRDNKAPYYLGNIYYGKELFDRGIEYFAMAVARGADYPTAYRNLAIGLFDKRGEVTQAGDLLRRAFDMNPDDERVFYELVQFERNAGVPLADRLEFIEAHSRLHGRTDELYLEVIATYLEQGDYDNAKALLADHEFYPYEGGEGILPALHMDTYMFLGKASLNRGDADQAIEYFEAMATIPDNYREGAMPQLRPIADYYIGTAYESMGDKERAAAQFQLSLDRGARGSDQLNVAGLCLQKLGRSDEAKDRFETLLDVAKRRLETKGEYPYFTHNLVFTLPFEHDTEMNNEANCAYLRGLALKGLGDFEGARSAFKRALELKPTMYRAADALAECT